MVTLNIDSLMISLILNLLMFIAIVWLSRWGFRHRLIAAQAKGEIIPKAKALAALTIKEFVKKNVDIAEGNKSLSGDQKKGYVTRAVNRKFDIDPTKLEDMIESEVLP